jgi:hypothetical protein
MTYKAKGTVSFESHTKHIKQCNQLAEFWNVIPGDTYSKRLALKG